MDRSGTDAFAGNASRIAYLILLSAAFPASLWYIARHLPDPLPFAGGFFILLIYLGGTIFLTFMLIFTQIHFPRTARGGLLTLGFLLLNAAAGAGTAGWDATRGAFLVISSHLFGITVFVALVLFMLSRKSTRGRIYIESSAGLTGGVLTALLVLTICLAWVYLKVAYGGIFGTGSFPAKLVCAAGFSIDLLNTAANYIRNNIMLVENADPNSHQSLVMSDWGIPILVCVIFSILASLFVAGGIASGRHPG